MATIAAPTARRRNAVGTLDLPGDIALTLVTLAVAVALVRAFRTWDPLLPLAAIVVTGHALSWVGRALRIPATVATLALLAIGTIVITVVYYRDLSWFGLPTTDVVSRALRDAGDAFGPFQKLVAPVDAVPGFTVTFAAGLWLMAVFADLAAARSDAPLQAVMPHIATFVFSSVLLLGRYAVPVTALFVATLVILRLAVRTSGVRRASAGRRTMTIWAAGVPMLVVMLIAGVVFSAAAPTTRGGLVDLRSIGRGPKARVVESPLVSLDALLGAQSDDVLFTVRSNEPHYWRLTSLDDFDGRSWSASARYRDLDDDEVIDSGWDPDVAVDRERIQVNIVGLRSDWLPTAYAPTAVDAPVSLRFDDGSSSVFVADGESTSNIRYTVSSEIADLERSVLSDAPSPVDASLEDFLKIEGVSRGVRDLAASLSTGGGAYADALALEAFFRSDRFVYDREANYRDSTDPLSDFLERGNGFCQQFATAFAAMARSLGIPSRVAVGFTYGEQSVGGSAGGSTTLWTVRGRYAHAWPEVYIHGVGWVAFEPTPGRGNPDATGYSDATVAQADNEGGGSVPFDVPTTTTTTTVIAGGVITPTTVASTLPQMDVDIAKSARVETETSRAPVIVLAAIVGVIALFGLIVGLRLAAVRRRRTHARAPANPPGSRIADSWQRVCHDLARVDVRSKRSETPLEFARRAAKIVEIEHLVRLGHRESDRRFRQRPPEESEAVEAETISDEVRSVVRSRLDRRQRLAADLDLRPRG